MNHGVVANTLTKPLRDLLIEHVDGTACVEPPFDQDDVRRKAAATALTDRGMIEFAGGATRITDDGRRVLACVLARYAEVLSRAGYTGIESPATKRGADAAAMVDVEWSPEEWRVTTRLGSARFRGRTQVAIFDLLWRKRGVPGMTRQRIVDIVFADDPDGGPLADSIHETVRRMRRTLAPVGVEIRRGTTGGNGYSLAVAEETGQFRAVAPHR